jgi:hypothetical protein
MHLRMKAHRSTSPITTSIDPLMTAMTSRNQAAHDHLPERLAGEARRARAT